MEHRTTAGMGKITPTAKIDNQILQRRSAREDNDDETYQYLAFVASAGLILNIRQANVSRVQEVEPRCAVIKCAKLSEWHHIHANV